MIYFKGLIFRSILMDFQDMRAPQKIKRKCTTQMLMRSDIPNYCISHIKWRMKWFIPFTCENHGFRFSWFIVTSHWFDQAEIVERWWFNLLAQSTGEITSFSNNESSANRKQSDEILVAIIIDIQCVPKKSTLYRLIILLL
jgi:hypothetical protein